MFSSHLDAAHPAVCDVLGRPLPTCFLEHCFSPASVSPGAVIPKRLLEMGCTWHAEDTTDVVLVAQS